MARWKIPMLSVLVVLNVHCAETKTTTGIYIPAGQQGLAPYGGEIPGDDDARFAEEQGPLCIGLAPPEDAYLPIEPEPDVSEDAEDERDTEENASADAVADTVSDVQEEDAETPADTAPLSDAEIADVADIEETDAWSGMMQTFSADASDALIDGGSEDTSSGGSGIQLPPALDLEEEEEPYDCTEVPQTCVGADAPEDFALFDFQPQSCGFQATYGLSLYKNHVTMVALLAAW